MTMIIACMQLVLKMLIAVKSSSVTIALVIVATKVMELISAMILTNVHLQTGNDGHIPI